MLKVWLIAITFSLISIMLTILIARFSKRILIKYIPSGIFGLFSIGFLVKSLYFSESFQDIAYMLMAILAFILTIVGLITAIVLDIIKSKKIKQ